MRCKYARDGKFLNLTVISTGDAALPGFGLLFEEREHLLQIIHLSLREFLLDVERSGEYAADVRRGHIILTKSCLQILLEHTTGPTLAYALRHGHVHLTDVLSRFDKDGRKDRDSVVVLQQWFGAFLRPRFGGKSVAEAEVRAAQYEAAQQERRRTQLETQAAARMEARRKRLATKPVSSSRKLILLSVSSGAGYSSEAQTTRPRLGTDGKEETA